MLSTQVVTTFTYKMEQGEKESLLPWGHSRGRAVQDSASGERASGHPTSLEVLRATSGGSGREQTHLPGLPESPHLALSDSRARNQARRQGLQELLSRPLSPDVRHHRQEGLEGSTANPPVRWRDGEESCRLQVPCNVPFLQAQRQEAATSSAASRSTQRGMGGGCYGECLGTNGFIRTRSLPERRGGTLLRGTVAFP